MRGENTGRATPPPAGMGSPPHARGKRRRVHGGRRRNGITPACAGKTTETRTSAAPKKDHPRMRGENGDEMSYTIGSLGSPPHARGKPGFEIRDTIAWRITPACAGKTPCRQRLTGRSRDHPRMRGENRRSSLLSSRAWGSPPHARGKRPCRRAARGFRRITPACAGKTTRRPWTRVPQGDHPRMRGENTTPLPAGAARRRITPACAGKTT